MDTSQHTQNEDSENQNQNSHLQESFTENLKHSFLGFVYNLRKFLIETLSIRDTDVQNTIHGIKRDIAFKGHTVWILAASIFIASIGLNVNSTAVVIGAMLISPLMGPILGIGLAVGTYDWNMLLRSLKNFGVAIFISLIVSTIYFMVTPLSDVQSELLSRTKPTFLDVLIATFGGMAGIIAGSRREKSNVVPGVAIATALMPPLCTAGFGLATANWNFFFGAFYLFFLNSFFISLSTLIFVKYLRFPQVNFVDAQRAKRIKTYMVIFVIVVILPSAKLFWEVIKESRFKANVELFLQENQKLFKGSEIINKKTTFTDTLSVIDLYIIGEKMPKTTISELNARLENYGLIKKGSFWRTGSIALTDRTVVRIHQSAEDYSELDSRLTDFSRQVRVGLLEDIYKEKEKELKNKNDQIAFLEEQIVRLSQKDTIPFSNVSREIKVLYEHIEKVAYARSIESDFSAKCDTIPTFLIRWDKRTWRKLRQTQSAELQRWLQTRLNLDTVRVVEY